MFSGFPGNIGRRINVRLAALFTGIVFAIAVFLSGFTYVLLSSSLIRKDRELLQSKVLELYVHFVNGGLENLVREVAAGSFSEGGQGFLILVRDPSNNPIYTHTPEFLDGVDLSVTKVVGVDRTGKFLKVRVGTGKKHVLEFASLQFENGVSLQVGMSIVERLAVLERFRAVSLLVLIPLIGLSFTGGAVLASRTLRPLRRLGATVRSVVETGSIKSRIPPGGKGGELDELVVLFNGMLDRIESLVIGMKGALDSVAHELRTPMTRLRVTAETALGEGGGIRKMRDALETSMEESEKILTMLNALMDISEAETGILRLNKKEELVSSLVDEVVELYRYAAEEREISIETSVPGDISLPVDPGRIRQAFANLVDNAIKYTPNKGRVRIEAFRNGDRVNVAFADTGIGIGNDEIDYIWDRLYRGKRARRHSGLGLGLSLVKAIVHAHGGSVTVESEEGKGSVFSVCLPLISSPPGSKSAAPSPGSGKPRQDAKP
jgi:signal transduction histidine kinase